MTRVYLFAAVVTMILSAAVAQTPPPTCGAAPPPPPETDAWAFQRADGSWTTLVPGWVSAPPPGCWVLGRVELKYPQPHVDGPPDLTPGPWVYTVDPEWPIGGKCPAQLNGVNDPHLCYSPPNPPIPPAP